MVAFDGGRPMVIMKNKSDELKEQNPVHDQDQPPTYKSGPAAFCNF